jgi:hypothetical protein
MIGSIIKPKRPKGEGWRQLPKLEAWVTYGYEGEAWQHKSGLSVISAVEVAADEGGISKGPEYHISVSVMGQRRATSAEAAWVLHQFDAEGAEEDNHVPNGIVRNFWRPVAEGLIGIECACKADEPAIKEDKGDYIWRGVTE